MLALLRYLLPYLGQIPCRTGSVAASAVRYYIKQEVDIQGKSNFFEKIVYFALSPCILVSYRGEVRRLAEDEIGG